MEIQKDSTKNQSSHDSTQPVPVDAARQLHLRESSVGDSHVEVLERVIEALLQVTKHDFRTYRKNTLLRRIRRRTSLLKIRRLEDYLDRLQEDPQEVAQLRNDLLIGVTRFFRDREAWASLGEQLIFPLLDSANDAKRPCRMWSIGCASGEEAYSLAILCLEHAERRNIDNNVQIFATDVSEKAIAAARIGYFAETSVQNLSSDHLKRYFDRYRSGYKVSRTLRDIVIFAEHNVLEDAPFPKLDLITCRNLLIYFNTEAQQRVVKTFRFALKEGGGLFLGPSESTGNLSHCFTAVDKRWRIFRRSDPHKHYNRTLKNSSLTSFSAQALMSRSESTPGIASLVHLQMMKELEEGLAVVDYGGQTLFLNGNIDLYLQLSKGEVLAKAPDLLEIVRDGLGRTVRDLLRRVKLSGSMETSKGRVLRNGGFIPVVVVARPLENVAEAILFSFRPDLEQHSVPSNQSKFEESSATERAIEEHILDLEQELARTRHQLMSAIESLEASNEESTAMNEELQAGNEELETSKEELRVLNDELAKANNQLEQRLQELQETTDDLNNLLLSTQLPTIFVDTNCQIRRFTPSISDLFTVTATDTGRALSSVLARFLAKDLLEDIGKVSADLQPREREIETDAGRSYIARLLPYRTADHRIQGVVITFNDVTTLLQTSRKLQARRHQAAALAELGRTALNCKDLQTLFDTTVQMVSRTLNSELSKILMLIPEKEELLLISGIGWKRGIVGQKSVRSGENSQAGYTLKSLAPVVVTDLKKETRFFGPSLLFDHDVVSGVSVIIGPSHAPWGVLGTHTTNKVQFSEDDSNFVESVANLLWQAIERHKKEERFRSTFDNAAVGIAHVGLDGKWLQVNDKLCQIVGYTPVELLQKRFHDITHPEDLSRDQGLVESTLRGEIDRYSIEKRYIHKSNHDVNVNLTVALSRRPDGEPDYFISIIEDVTERSQIQRQLAESKQQLQTFLDNAPVMMGLVELPPDNSDILHIIDNASTEQFFGVGSGATLGKWSSRDLNVPRAKIDYWCENYRKSQQTGAPVHFQHAHIKTTGCDEYVEKNWLSVTVSHIGTTDEGRDRFCYIALDETQRVQAEADLKSSHDTFLNLIENAPFGVYVIDADLRLQSVSRGSARVFENVNPLIGRDFSEVLKTIWPEPFASEALAKFRHTLETGEPFEATETTESRNDTRALESYHWQLDRVTMPDGRFGVVCYFYEMTELKQAERALREHEQRQALLLELVKQNRETDDEARIFSSAAEALGKHLNAHRTGFFQLEDDRLVFTFGWSDGTLPILRGQLPVKAFGTKFLEEIQQNKTVGIANTETDPLTTDSEFIHLDTRALLGTPIFRNGDWQAGLYIHHATERTWTDEEISLVRKVADQTWDAVERTRFVKAIGESEGRLRLAVELANVGVLVCDYERDTATLDSIAGKLFDLPANQPIPRASVHERFHPDERKKLLNQIETTLDPAGSGTLETEHRIVHENGRVLWLNVCEQVKFVQDAEGRLRPSVSLIAAIDVTDRREHEEKLDFARRQAEAANRARGEFLANMSHEIRTPMTAILGYADLLSGHLKDPDNMQCVETIRRNGRFLLDIINDILDLSKIDAGRMEIDKERIAPEQIVADAVSLMNVRAEEKKIELIAEFDGKLPKLIETDGKRLRQILLNLLGNAIKFTDRGQVRLTVRHNPQTAKIEFKIQDTGIGMEKGFLARLFQPFTQADASVTRSFGGTGLGLAISRRLATMLGGDIEVESILGLGSTFTLSIDPGPLKGVHFIEPSILASEPAPVQTNITLRGKFLIVDDRRDIRFLAQHIIEQAGGLVTTANNGQEGVDTVLKAVDEKKTFDVILMDMQMPVMDGYAAVTEIRRRGIRTPIIALTANAMDGDAEDCTQVGCDAFISKPINRQKLLRTIANFLQPN